MLRTLIFMLAFLPTAVLSQQLQCCETKSEVESTINGLWQREGNPKEQQRYEFKDGVGTFSKLTYDDNEVLLKTEGVGQNLEIFKTSDGFRIDFSDGNRFVTSRIKVLNQTTFIVVRRDGKESKLLRVEK